MLRRVCAKLGWLQPQIAYSRYVLDRHGRDVRDIKAMNDSGCIIERCQPTLVLRGLNASHDSVTHCVLVKFAAIVNLNGDGVLNKYLSHVLALSAQRALVPEDESPGWAMSSTPRRLDCCASQPAIASRCRYAIFLQRAFGLGDLIVETRQDDAVTQIVRH